MFYTGNTSQYTAGLVYEKNTENYAELSEDLDFLFSP